MAYPISFDKETAERYIEALRSGQPVSPPDGRWTISTMMALAGVCYFACMSHGPLSTRSTGGNPSPEHQEARAETLFSDLSAAIQFYGQLTMMVKDGEFDDHFEPHVEAAVYEDGTGRHVQPHKGFKRI
jgi:hypothetical protein